MKFTDTVRPLAVAVACAGVLLFAAPAARATPGTPISSTSVGLDHEPEGIHVASGVTDGSGAVTFGNLAPGRYVLVIDGSGLVTAMDKLTPLPEKKSSGSSFSLGIGGFFGGGSSHTSGGHGGAGPIGGGSQSSSHSSGAGMGVGVGVPLGGGGDKGSDRPGYPIVGIGISLPSQPDLKIETPYCADAASHGMRIGFTVPEGGSSEASITIARIWDDTDIVH